MGSIVSTGIGSGLDIETLVSQLVAAEGKATSTQLDTKEARLQARLSAYGSFRSAVDTLQTAVASLKSLSKFQARATTVGDESVLAATADSTAATGSYAILVERLASAAKLQSGPVATADTVVGTGTLTLNLGASSLVFAIDSTNNTLAQLRDAINTASGNPGISATIVTGLDGAHLILTGSKTGAANALTVTQSGGDGGLAQFVYDPAHAVTNLTAVQTAADSRVIIDGIAVESATNTVSTGVTGLTLGLKAVSEPNVTTTVGVSFDVAATRKAIDDFAKAYNTLVTTVKPLSSFDAATKVGGPLLGDSTLRDFQNAARRAVNAPVGGGASFNNLTQIGITFGFDGTISVDSVKLANALDGQFDAVGQLFASTDGVAKRLDAVLSQYTGSTGLIGARTDGLQTSIKEIGDQRGVLQTRLGSLETRLRAQFNAMDKLVAQLKSTSNFLTQQLAASQTATINRA